MRSIGSLTLAAVMLATLLGAAQDGDWPAYGRDPGGERFSPLDASTATTSRRSRSRGRSAPATPTARSEGRPTAFEATPLYVDGTLYLSTPLGRVIALDPDHRPAALGRSMARSPRDKGYGDFASRGVSTWQPRQRAPHLRRDDRRAPDRARRRDRAADAGFGESGIVDLRQGLRIAPDRLRRLRGDLAARRRRQHHRRRLGDRRRHRRSRTRAARCAASMRSPAS